MISSYNDVYGNGNRDYANCTPSEGSISLDPLFNDLDNNDYNLTWRSPCINAGDPSFPRDPDGSIVDMGAFYFNSKLGVNQNPTATLDCGLKAAPNPFNQKTYLQVRTILAGIVYIKVYNLSGRKVYEDKNEFQQE